MKMLLLKVKLLIESLLVETGFKGRDVEISGIIPDAVAITQFRLRRHNDGCGIIGKVSIRGDIPRIVLQATFLDFSGRRCDYQERPVLVSDGDRFNFSLISQHRTISKALLAVSV